MSNPKLEKNHHKQAGEICEGGLGGRENLGEEGWREFATAGGLLFGAQHGGRDDDDNEDNAADDDDVEPWRGLSEDDLITLGSLMCWRAMRVKANLSEKAGLHPVGCQRLE